MDETKFTADLPRLDVEIVRRDHPEEQAEVVTIEMRATPSFRAVSGHLASTPMGQMTMLLAMPLAWSVMPMALWARSLEAAWRPWLALNPARAWGDRWEEAGRAQGGRAAAGARTADGS